MKTYARVVDGVVVEIIGPCSNEDGVEVPIDERFAEELVVQMVDVTKIRPMPDQQWTYSGKKFSEPMPYKPSADEIKAANTSERDRLLSAATLAIAPLQDAEDLEEATAAETALLKKWKQYRVAVNRVDLNLEVPSWPISPV